MLQLEDQESSHSATIDNLRLDHKKEIDELREKMKQLKKELKGVLLIVTTIVIKLDFFTISKVAPKSNQSPCTIVHGLWPDFIKIEKERICHFYNLISLHVHVHVQMYYHYFCYFRERGEIGSTSHRTA